MKFDNSSPILIILYFILFIWTMVWKALALWKAARYEQPRWFIALFIALPLNLLGILEITYLFRFAKKRMTLDEVKSWFQTTFFTKVSDQKKKRSSK